MKKTLILLLCLFISMSMMLLVSCDRLSAFLPDTEKPDKPTQLNVPSVSFADDAFTWQSVANAIGYEVDVDGTATTLGKTELSVTLTDGQTAKVRALGDGTDYADSAWSESLTYTEPEIEYVTYTFKYNGKKICDKKFVKGEPLSEEDIAFIDTIRYNGYGFAEWYTDSNLNSVFDRTVPADTDCSIHGKRGNLAGVDIYYDYNTETGVLTLTGSGDMFDFLYDDDAPWVSYKSLCQEIVFEGEITSIGNNSFHGFTALSSVYLPDSLLRIGECAFYKSSVHSVRFPPNLTDIGMTAFYQCKNLTRLDLNEALVNVGRSAFAECSGLVNIVVNDKLAELGTSAFLNCFNIESAYYIGTEEQYNAIKIRLDNFWMNELANTYFYSESKPDAPGPYWYYGEDEAVTQWYYTVGYLATNAIVPFAFDYVDPDIGITQDNIDFRNAIFYRGYQFDRWDHKTGDDVTFAVGNRLTSDVRFEGKRVSGGRCGDTLTWKISGTTLTIRGDGAMWDFQAPGDAPWAKKIITSVNIKSGVTYIGSFAFSGHVGLESLNIPTNVKGVSTKMLSGCSALRYIYYAGNSAALAEVEGLNSLENALDAVVYSNNTEQAPGEGCFWRSVTVGSATRIVAWELKDGTLTVGTAEKVIINFTSPDQTPWYNDSASVTKVVIRDGITTVGHYSFDGMSTVTQIVMPDSVQKTSGVAFTGTGYYTNPENWVGGALYISNHLIKVDYTAIGTTFTVKKGVVSIAEEAFENCSTITELVLPNGLVGIYSTAFNGLSGLVRVLFNGTANAYATLMDSNSAAKNNLSSVAPDHLVYYYSKNTPTIAGNWWHYVQGQIEIWPALDGEE